MDNSRSKCFVIDTNVLLHDPEAIVKFPRHQVILPVAVLEELDKMKRLPNELGKNARAVFHLLDSLQNLGEGCFHTGVKLPNGSTIRLLMEASEHRPIFSMSIKENKILMAAYDLFSKGELVVFVSKDFATRIKAEAIGLLAQDYANLKFSYDAIYRGVRQIILPKRQIDLFYKEGSLPLEEIPIDFPLTSNEYCLLTSQEQSSALARYHSKNNCLEPLLPTRPLWGLKARNTEQRVAIDLLLRDEIKLVTLMGPAGTGKTLLALASALQKVFDEGVYTKIIVSRPIVPLGHDIGYLPGSKEEKLLPWMQPIYDNLEFLCESAGSRTPKETLQWVIGSQKIETEAVTYIRGRSLPKIFFIVDEAQNLTPHEVKTIISRAGEGTKVVLTGDATQIDNPYLDKDSNGLTYTVGTCKESPLFGHIFLEKTERSELAAMAAQVM